MSLSKYRSKVVSITLSIRNITVRHNFYFQIIGSFLILSLVSYLHFMQPLSLDVISFTMVDKLAHFLMFFLTTMWFMYISKKWLVTAVSLLLLALVFEWIQMNYITNRSFEWGDWIADGIGIALCFLLLPILIDKYFDSSV